MEAILYTDAKIVFLYLLAAIAFCVVMGILETKGKV